MKPVRCVAKYCCANSDSTNCWISEARSCGKIGCALRKRSSARRENHVVARGIPSAERLDSTGRTGQGRSVHKDRCACSPSPDRTELLRCIYGHVLCLLLSTTSHHKPQDTHLYSTQAYQFPSQRWLAPWLASMVGDVWGLLEHLSHPVFGHSASALRGSTPERSRSRFQMTSYSHHSRCPETATAPALCAQLQHSATEGVIGEG